MQILIRPLVENDAYISYKWRNNPVIWKYTGNKPDIQVTPEVELNWIKKVLSHDNERRFAILADGQYIGNTYLTGITQNDAEFHIFIGEPDLWGKGIASVVLDKIMLVARNELNLRNLYLTVNSGNVAAKKLYNTKGFKVTNIDDGDIIHMSVTL